MHVTIVGAGYVGLVTGACLARLGHRVELWEADPDRRETLRRGRVPFHEPGLQELLTDGIAQGRISVAETPATAFTDAELVLICVGTPLRADGGADLSQVEAACGVVAMHAPAARVVVRSTLPLGSTATLPEWLGQTSTQGVVTNPEFLRQGTAIHDFLTPTRIVIGTKDGDENQTSAAVRALYVDIDAPIIVTDFSSAEMIKNASNAFLATKLSFINEVADLCEVYGADVDAVVEGMGHDPRIGGSYLRPGIGFGGSCLPKELANMVRLGQRRGLAMPLMAGAAQTNEIRPSRIVDRLEGLLGSLRGCRVAILGLSFKPDTDDLRYSPSLALAETLVTRGASVVAHDPVVTFEATGASSIERVAAPEDAITSADLVVLGTEWPLYRQLDWKALASISARSTLYDGRNALDRQALINDGWRIISVGVRD